MLSQYIHFRREILKILSNLGTVVHFIMKKTILFLCTGNSCRSQMAEGFCRKLRGDEFEAYSAGVEPKTLDARAVEVMKEVGIDISQQKPKSVEQLPIKDFDLVITVCGHANENCPFFPNKTKVIHVGFEDPPLLAKECTTEQQVLEVYRRVRDQIADFVKHFAPPS
ncbi:arsenate reductase [Galdieria sulphuraria]|uniref:Arsenate reductase n=1 Tax=Galdieria sulphuraria TaxID=130081 RepID=M2WQF3_GALSU|nr:arsenate reductase [Galdieria sulphuraria]EME26015.1 arsenate reductase [Galdieria sulphuraria]|eukprot:XP_005702535.1 arsenate reductase [Galdieria sulphuraria]